MINMITPGIYDFDVIRGNLDTIRKEQEQAVKEREKANQDESVIVPSPEPNEDYMFCRDAFKHESISYIDLNGLRYPIVPLKIYRVYP